MFYLKEHLYTRLNILTGDCICLFYFSDCWLPDFFLIEISSCFSAISIMVSKANTLIFSHCNCFSRIAIFCCNSSWFCSCFEVRLVLKKVEAYSVQPDMKHCIVLKIVDSFMILILRQVYDLFLVLSLVYFSKLML